MVGIASHKLVDGAHVSLLPLGAKPCLEAASKLFLGELLPFLRDLRPVHQDLSVRVVHPEGFLQRPLEVAEADELVLVGIKHGKGLVD